MENLKEKLEGIKIITRHPNRDWHKMSFVLLILATLSLVWNIYFYFSVRQAIESSETNNIINSGSDSKNESEIVKTLKRYEDKSATHESLKSSTAERLEDPATS